MSVLFFYLNIIQKNGHFDFWNSNDDFLFENEKKSI